MLSYIRFLFRGRISKLPWIFSLSASASQVSGFTGFCHHTRVGSLKKVFLTEIIDYFLCKNQSFSFHQQMPPWKQLSCIQFAHSHAFLVCLCFSFFCPDTSIPLILELLSVTGENYTHVLICRRKWWVPQPCWAFPVMYYPVLQEFPLLELSSFLRSLSKAFHLLLEVLPILEHSGGSLEMV